MARYSAVIETTHSQKVSLTISRVLCYAVLIFLTLISLFPFIVLILNATRSHYQIMSGDFSLVPGTAFIRNFTKMITQDTYPVLDGLRNSFAIAASSTVLTVYFSVMTAFGLHAYEFKLKNFAFTFILVILMVPSQVSVTGLIKEMYAFGWMGTYWPLIIPAISAPATVFFMKQYMQSSLPLEIVEAARIDGGNEFYNFNRIVLPIMKPAVAVQAIFAFVTSWNNFFIPAMIFSTEADVKKKTLPVIIALLKGADYKTQDQGLIYMLIFMSIIPIAIVYLFLSKFIIRGVALGGVKG